MIYLHHAASLALIYISRATYGNANMVTIEQTKKYQDTINDNLKNMQSKVSNLATSDFEIDPDELFFTYARDIKGEGYYILKTDSESLTKRQKYIMNLPLDIVLASQKKNALEAIDLIMIDGKIIKKEQVKIKKKEKI